MPPTKIRPGKVFLQPNVPVDIETNAIPVQLYVWDTAATDWVPYTGGGSGGGGSGPDLVGIKDYATPTQRLAVDANGRIGINNFPADPASMEITNDAGNPIPVSGSVSVSNFPGSQPVTGPLTDTQLRAAAVPVSLGSVPSHPVTGPLTDAQLRATAVPVSGTVALDSASLSALETIQVGSLPAVALDSGSLAALETIQVGNFPASQAVTGPLTDAQLRATPVPISGTVAIGAGTTPTYKGRASTLRTPGRAGTANANIMTLWNGSGAKIVRVNGIGIDLTTTVVKAVTVLPPIVRIYRVTAAPTNGATLTKAAEDSTLSSDANIVLRGDASADGTLAASALAATASGGALTQEFAPRLITAAGYEMFDKTLFFDMYPLIIRPNEGFLVRLDYTLATQNPATDMWIAHVMWTEE